MKSFDFQVHSRFSFDSLSKIRQIKRKAKKEGIEGIAITDHETIEGGLHSKNYTDDDFLFIAGQEIETDKGDIIGLMINEQIQSKSFFEVVDEIKDQNGITYLPHPSRKMTIDFDDVVNHIDVVEAVNGRSSKYDNIKSMKFARSLKLPYAAGSDSHAIREIGKTYTHFSEHFYDEDTLRKLLLDKSVNRRIFGFGGYELKNHLQSSIVGTLRTGKFREFGRGITKRIKID